MFRDRLLKCVTRLLQFVTKCACHGWVANRTSKDSLILLGAPKTTEQQTKETIPGLSQTPLMQPSVPGQTPQLPGQTPQIPGQTPQIPGLTDPLQDASQPTQFLQNQLQGQTPLLPGQPQQPSPLAPPPLPVSPFSSNPPTPGQQPLLPPSGAPLENTGLWNV